VLRAAFYLRRKGVTLGGRPATFHGRMPRIKGGRRIRVGSRFKVDGHQIRAELACSPDGRIVIGDNVYLNRGTTIYAEREVTIGDDCRFADQAAVYDTNFHEVGEGEGITVAPVRIGSNVWIGRQALILPGTEIGDHAVVGAGAVVRGVVPPRTLVAGSPAQVVRTFEAADDYVRP